VIASGSFTCTWTPDDARRVLEEHRRVGGPLAEFARRHSISSARLYWWRKRLADERPNLTALSLVPATVVSPESAGITIRMPSGIAIEDCRSDAERDRAPRRGVDEDVAVILVPRAVRVYFATAPQNLRKSFDGLSNEIRHALGYDPLGGHVFVFLNRRKNQVKLIVWTRGGFTIVHQETRAGDLHVPGTRDRGREAPKMRGLAMRCFTSCSAYASAVMMSSIRTT
jgi:transposase-like protein